MTSVEGYSHIYVSPHLDDVVFSCAGRIWQQTRAGQPVAVVTVFGGAPEPGAPLSPYARELHARWGSSNDPVRQRQVEDVQALALLSAEPIHWPYLDCIYRATPQGEFAYVSEDALWGEIHTSDEGIVEELEQRMRALPLASSGSLYAPIGVGRHVDHRIVRRAAESSGHPLIYYEDFPYAQDPRALSASLAPDRWEPRSVPLSQQALDAKVAAIACYESQISTFWGGRTGVDAAVRAFAEQTGEGEPAERYWRRTDS